MTDVFEISDLGRNADAAKPGLANPIFVGLSIVATIAASVLAVRSVIGGDHRAHVWNVRLFGVVIASVSLLAILRIGTRFVHRARRIGRQDMGPPLLDAEPWGGQRPGRGVRRHRRVVPANRVTTLRTGDGRTIDARILNVSLGGVAVEAPVTVAEFSMVVKVGSRPAGPVRRIEGGAVFRFDHLLDPLELGDNLVL